MSQLGLEVKVEPKTIALNPTCAGTSFQRSFLKSEQRRLFTNKATSKVGLHHKPPSLTLAQTTEALLFLGLLYKVLTHTLYELWTNRKAAITGNLLCQALEASRRAGQLGTLGHEGLPPQHTRGSSMNSPGRRRPGERERGNFLTSLDVRACFHSQNPES